MVWQTFCFCVMLYGGTWVSDLIYLIFFLFFVICLIRFIVLYLLITLILFFCN